jgi:hypothetical protein
MTPRRLSRKDLFAVVEERADAVRDYLLWARLHDDEHATLRMSARPDIGDAATAAEAFPEKWWGVVVFTCFGSRRGAAVVAPQFQHPLSPSQAEAALDDLALPAGAIGHHRIQPAHKGAKQALVSACAAHDLFRDILHCGEDFDTRFRRLRSVHLRQWGRTTSFDLLLRAGALGIGGKSYKPEFAYLGGSTGPKAGFARVWGFRPNDQAAVDWAERLLRAWAEEWQSVVESVGVAWDRPPLEPCDQENFLCVYQERRRSR